MRSYLPDDLMSPAVFADPYPAYRYLRETSPVEYTFLSKGAAPGVDEPLKAWAVLKHADVTRVLEDPVTFSSRSPTIEKGLSPRLTLIFDDPPRHSRLRRLVNKAFTPKQVEKLEPWMASITSDLIDQFQAGEVEIMEHLAIPLPMRVIARLIGIPENEYRQFRDWSEACLSTLSMSRETRARRLGEMMAYFQRMAAVRRSARADDLLSALVLSEIDGESLTDEEIIGFCILLLVAGNETTVNLIANTLNVLAQQPALWESLRRDRRLVELVVQESLRYESPIQRLSRKATRDVQIGQAAVSKGDWLSVFYGAANRDPAAFADPDEFRLDRDFRQHLAFGSGIHYCMGAALAQLEARLTLNALLDRFTTLTPGKTPAVRQAASYFVAGFQSLPLRFQAAG